VQVRAQEDVAAVEEQRRRTVPVTYQRPEGAGAVTEAEPAQGAARANPTPFVRRERKVGRNEPCPCGSGKKYKQCHGRLS
jgi:preprotein translocase subunit SecA